MQPGDWEVESPGQGAEQGGGRNKSTLIWATAVAVLLVIGAGLVVLAIWLTDSPDVSPALPDVEAPVTQVPTPEVEIPATPTVVAELTDRGEPSELYNESAFGRINVTLADGTDLFMRLPGIGDNAEVALWDETQFVVGGIAVTVYFEACTSRENSISERNERGQSFLMPNPSIVKLCENRFDLPLSAVLFSGEAWQPDELVFVDMRLLEAGSELGLRMGDRRSHYGPLRAGELVLFSSRFELGTLAAFDPESGDVAWGQPAEEPVRLLATTGETALVALWKDSVIAVDATNGEERWRTNFGKYARVTSAAAIGEGEWLVTYEYVNEGDPAPPGVARLDASGEMLWTATGREGTDWSWDVPIIAEGRIFLRDVPHAWADAGRVSVTAFDTETGDLLWRTELGSTSEGYPSNSLAISQDSGSFLVATLQEEDQIVRLDATTGEIAWTGVKPPGRILSVRDSTIRIGNSLSENKYDINPANGLLRGLVR